MRTHRRQLAALTATLLLLANAGRSYADGILLESYSSERPGDADALIAPIRDELASRQYATGHTLTERIATRLSEPATILPAVKLDEAARFIKSGYAQHVAGQWNLAVGELSRGVDLLFSAPVSMVREQERRDQLFEGLVALARSYKRAGNDVAATRAMSEVLRTFPDRELSRAKYAPDVHEFYSRLKQELAASGLGRLEVNADAGVMVFVNERFVGLGEVEAARREYEESEERVRREREQERKASERAAALKILKEQMGI